MARVQHRLKLMADYQCFPLWWHGGRWIGMIQPDVLPLSEELKRRLSAWAAVYDGLMQTDYQWPSAAAQAAFVRDGRVLLAALREELGPDYEVWYVNDLTGQLER
jgi:hypothetical protein